MFQSLWVYRKAPRCHLYKYILNSLKINDININKKKVYKLINLR